MPEKPAQPNQPLEFAESLLGGSLTIFGRLVSVASLRDPKSGQYRHTLINHLLDEQSLQDTLCRLHRKYFVEWLGLTLTQVWEGPTTLAWGAGSIAELSRELDTVFKRNDKVKFKGAVADGQTLRR